MKKIISLFILLFIFFSGCLGTDSTITGGIIAIHYPDNVMHNITGLNNITDGKLIVEISDIDSVFEFIIKPQNTSLKILSSDYSIFKSNELKFNHKYYYNISFIFTLINDTLYYPPLFNELNYISGYFIINDIDYQQSLSLYLDENFLYCSNVSTIKINNDRTDIIVYNLLIKFYITGTCAD